MEPFFFLCSSPVAAARARRPGLGRGGPRRGGARSKGRGAGVPRRKREAGAAGSVPRRERIAPPLLLAPSLPRTPAAEAGARGGARSRVRNM